MNINFKTYEKPSSTIFEINSRYNWKNFINEVNNTHQCEVYVYMFSKVGMEFDFCSESIIMNYSQIPTGCDNLSFTTKTIFGRTMYKLRLTKKTTQNILAQYIESVLKECGIKDAEVNVFVDEEIQSKLK